MDVEQIFVEYATDPEYNTGYVWSQLFAAAYALAKDGPTTALSDMACHFRGALRRDDRTATEIGIAIDKAMAETCGKNGYKRLETHVECLLETAPKHVVRENVEWGLLDVRAGREPITQSGQIIQEAGLTEDDIRPILRRLKS